MRYVRLFCHLRRAPHRCPFADRCPFVPLRVPLLLLPLPFRRFAAEVLGFIPRLSNKSFPFIPTPLPSAMKISLVFALLAVLLCVSVAGQMHTAQAVEEAPLPFEAAEPQPLQPIIAEGQSRTSRPIAQHCMDDVEVLFT